MQETDTSDPYQGPTLNDLTTDVNFSLLSAEGELAALKTVYFGPQSALRAGTAINLPGANEWSQNFETNVYYKLMVQQKQGTDASYSYPQSRQEPLTTDPSTLSEVQRQRAQEIEKRLIGTPGSPSATGDQR
jgi:SAM-dependent MidA family methyltransferase